MLLFTRTSVDTCVCVGVNVCVYACKSLSVYRYKYMHVHINFDSSLCKSSLICYMTASMHTSIPLTKTAVPTSFGRAFNWILLVTVFAVGLSVFFFGK